MDYQKQAKDFLEKHKIKMKIILSNTKKPLWLKANENCGNHYKVTLKNKHKQITFDFWDSIRNKEENLKPTEYDILACISYDTCYQDYSFQEFCDNLGYNPDSIKDLNMYDNCVKFSKKLINFLIFDEVIEDLKEIS